MYHTDRGKRLADHRHLTRERGDSSVLALSASSIPLLAIAYGIAAGASFLLSVTIGRALGVVALGSFALAVAVARIFYAVTDLGVPAHMTKVLSRDRTMGAEYLSLFVVFRASLIPVASVLTASVAVARGDGRDEIVLFGLVAIALGLVTLQGLYEAILLAHEHQQWVATLTVLGSACVAAGALLWFWCRGTLVEFGLVYAAAMAIGNAAWAYWTGTRMHLWPRRLFDSARIKIELSRSWPIGISMFLGIASLKSPVLVLGVFGTSEDVGAFAAVDMFVTASAILQAAVTSATFPRLASSFRTDPPGWRSAYWGSNAALAVAGLGIGLFLTLFGGTVISMVFPGKDFARITTLMPIVGWSAPSLLLVHHNILIFAAADKERMNLRLMAIWFIIVATFQLALVPSYGVVGAAWGVLVGRMLGLVVISLAAVSAAIPQGGVAGSR